MGYATDLLPFSLTNTVTSNNPGDLHHYFKLTASADVTVSLTGMTANFDCTVGTNNCSNNAGNADDTWSGTLAAGSHRIAVSISALETSGGTYTLSAAADPPTPTDPDGNDDEDDDENDDEDEDDDEDVDDAPDPPGAPTLSGSVTVTKHILTWTAPTSSSDITLPVGVPSLRNHELEFPDGWLRDRIKPECHHTDVEHRHFGLGGSVLPGCSVQRGRRRPVVQRDQAGVRRPAGAGVHHWERLQSDTDSELDGSSVGQCDHEVPVADQEQRERLLEMARSGLADRVEHAGDDQIVERHDCS